MMLWEITNWETDVSARKTWRKSIKSWENEIALKPLSLKCDLKLTLTLKLACLP